MIVTVEELKAHLNITFDDDDALIADKIAVAEACVAEYVGADLEADFETLPTPLREAVKQLAAHFYENREAVLVGATAQTLPLGVFDLVGPYREWCF